MTIMGVVHFLGCFWFYLGRSNADVTCGASCAESREFRNDSKSWLASPNYTVGALLGFIEADFCEQILMKSPNRFSRDLANPNRSRLSPVAQPALPLNAYGARCGAKE